jgi:hypothetical protein
VIIRNGKVIVGGVRHRPIRWKRYMMQRSPVHRIVNQ